MSNRTLSLKKLRHVDAHAEGVVKWFNLGRGYGFVTLPDKSDVLVHASVANECGVVMMPTGAPARVTFRSVGGLKRATRIEVLRR